MIKEQLFNETVDILVKAYQNDTLTYSDCQVCAVGNIVAARMGLYLRKTLYFEWPVILVTDKAGDTSDVNTSDWADFISLGSGSVMTTVDPNSKGAAQIALTGYTVLQIAKIEAAFYNGCYPDLGNMSLEDTFGGLMAVVDCLMEIHEADKALADTAKLLFVKN